MEKKLRITSTNEQITEKEFFDRIASPEFCFVCGAALLGLTGFTDRCGACTNKYYEDWLKSSKGIPGSGGLFGAE